MVVVETEGTLLELKQSKDVLLVLFGGKECGVCHAIKPKLIGLMAAHYPLATIAYIDCHATPELGAQQGVLSLPTLQVFFGGQKFIEEVRTFSLQKVIDNMARPYQMITSD